MGDMDLTEFREELRFNCGGINSTSTAFTNERLDRYINASYLWVCMPNHYRHPELEDTLQIPLVANTATYTLLLASPWLPPFMVYGVSHVEAAVASITDATRRTKLDPIDFRSLMTIQRSTGPPRLYSYWNESIHVNTVPDTASVGQTLEVYCYMQPVPLTYVVFPTSTVIRREWDEVILKGAEWRLWMALGEVDRAYEAKQDYAALLNEVADFRRSHAEEWGWQNEGGPELYMRTD